LTFITLWLEATLPAAEGGRRLAHDMPTPPSGRYGPYALQAWAKREGLAIEYIDNLYLYVPMDRGKLGKFLKELYGDTDPYPDAVLASLGPQWETTIWAEEF
jgi:hypothetical protein